MAAKKNVVKRSRAKMKKKAGSSSKKRPSAKSQPKIAPAVAVVVTHEMIEKHAHEIWMKKNHIAHTNNAPQNWLEAETELRSPGGK